jgi:hypothetical protein
MKNVKINVNVYTLLKIMKIKIVLMGYMIIFFRIWLNLLEKYNNILQLLYIFIF